MKTPESYTPSDITDLEKQLAEARQVAHCALQEIGELSIVLEFYRQLHACMSTNAMLNLLSDTLSYFQVESVVRMESVEGEAHIYPASSPLAEAFDHVPNTPARLCHTRDDNLYIRFPDVQLYVEGAPLAGEGAGRLRDHLAMLVEGVQTRLVGLAKLPSIN